MPSDTPALVTHQGPFWTFNSHLRLKKKHYKAGSPMSCTTFNQKQFSMTYRRISRLASSPPGVLEMVLSTNPQRNTALSTFLTQSFNVSLPSGLVTQFRAFAPAKTDHMQAESVGLLPQTYTRFPAK